MTQKQQKPLKKCLNCGKPTTTDFCSMKCVTSWANQISPFNQYKEWSDDEN